MLLVGRLGVGILSVVVVALKLFSEVGECELVVVKKILIGYLAVLIGGCYCGEVTEIGLDIIRLDSLNHLQVGYVIGRCGRAVELLVGLPIELYERHNTLLSSAGSGLVDSVLVVVVAISAEGLVSVRRQALDIGRINSRRAGIYGVKVNVEVEQYVLHSERMSVRILDTIL